MFVLDFERIVNRFRWNDNISHRVALLYTLLTGTTLVTEADFEQWFLAKVADLGLVEDLHYRFDANDICSVKVRGSVGLNMILSEQSDLGSHARIMCGVDHVPMRLA
jgi:hypothetical protein